MCRFKFYYYLLSNSFGSSFNTSYVSVQVHWQRSYLAVIPGFNTSYVSVQDPFITFSPNSWSGFNTSYVSVQDKKTIEPKYIDVKFQYIICVGSSIYQKRCKRLHQVSIHHMCRFKTRKTDIGVRMFVSIHHMCRFKISN